MSGGCGRRSASPRLVFLEQQQRGDISSKFQLKSSEKFSHVSLKHPRCWSRQPLASPSHPVKVLTRHLLTHCVCLTSLLPFHNQGLIVLLLLFPVHQCAAKCRTNHSYDKFMTEIRKESESDSVGNIRAAWTELEGSIIRKCLVTWINSNQRTENGRVKCTGRTILELQQEQYLTFMLELSVCLELSRSGDRALTRS